jgi:hypothetical protein
MGATYRRHWKHGYTGTPASIAFHAMHDVVLVNPNPGLITRMHNAAAGVRFAAPHQIDAALAKLAGLVQEAHEAGHMIDVTTNRAMLRSNSSKHCITLHVRKAEQSQDQASRVFINQMSRATHDDLLPRIRGMFVAGVVADTAGEGQ